MLKYDKNDNSEVETGKILVNHVNKVKTRSIAKRKVAHPNDDVK